MSELPALVPTQRGVQTLRVLLLEDSAFDAELLKEELLNVFPHATLQLVRDERAFATAVDRGDFDVILSDHDLGGYSGRDALTLAQKRAPLVPFIFVSGVIGEDNAAELIKQGATDYVSKGRLERLPLVLERALREAQERGSRIAAELELIAAKEETERLAAQLAVRLKELAEGEARLNAATDAGGIGVWQLDLRELELYASHHCKSNFGRDETLPFTYEELQAAVHPDDLERMRSAVAHTIATGEDYRIEYRILRPNGQLAWVRIMGRMEYGPQGEPMRMSGISQEITDAMISRRRGELLEYLDRHVFRGKPDPTDIAYGAAEAMANALDVSRAGYGAVDHEEETITIQRDWTAPGISTVAGTRVLRDYGTFVDDLKRGETVVFADAAKDPRTRDKADALIAIDARALINVPVTEGDRLVALFFLTAKSPRYWTAEEMRLVREVAHKTRHAMERRRAEQDLHALANSLERKVKERTAELMKSEAALRQSQKMEAVGQLTGGLAHDFNNLLGAISGSLELLKRRMGHEELVQRYVDISQTAAKRAAALTHRLLAFSRQQTLEPKVVSVNQLIDGLEGLVRPTIGPQIELEVVPGASVWAVHADPGQLENALLNLCINARDAMPDGGRLVVETTNRTVDELAASEEHLQPGQYVSICVRDSGTGMSPDTIAHAFDPFFTTKPLGLGTGLGLSMVYGFAKQSGGKAHITSTVGEGTSVSIFLPRYVGEDVLTVDRVAPKASLSNVGAGETILVLDDEEAVRMLMVEMLQDMGYRVLHTGDGAQAIDILRENRSIALLVTDVGLPGGMNGRQVADAARTLLPNLQVLFVTGYAETAVLSHGHLPQGMQVLTKPFELEVFGQRVQDLTRSKTRQAHPLEAE